MKFLDYLKIICNSAVIFMTILSCDLEAQEESMVDLTYNRLSSSLFFLSNRLDSFFGGERADDLPNGSRVRIFWNLNQEEGIVLKGEVAVRFNIALVETQKKLKVSFKNKYEEEYEQGPTNQAPDQSAEQSPPQAPHAYDLNELLRWRIKLDSGIRIDFPPDPFARLSSLKTWSFGSYEIRPSQQLFWYLKSGFGETTKFDLDRPINEDLLLRYENDVTWTNESDAFTFYSGPILLQQLSDKRGITYGAKLFGQSRPTWFVNDYRLELTYRQLLFRKWFFVEFNPYLHFPKVKSWDSSLGFNLRFEVVIGSY